MKPPVPAEAHGETNDCAPSQEGTGDRAFLPCTIALAVLALGLGLLRLDHNDIWFDEAASLLFARQRGLDFFRVILREDTHGPVYYGLLHLWVRLLGESAWVCRLPSVLCAAGVVVVLVRFGGRLFGRTVGLLAGLLVALSPYHLYYAQEIRFYSFIECLVSLNILCFVVLVTPSAQGTAVDARSSRWPWWGFVTTAVLCLLTFYMSALLIVAELAAAALMWKQIKRKRVLVAAFAAVALLFACWLPALHWQIRHTHGSIAWIPRRPLWDFLRHTCLTFTAGKGATLFDRLAGVMLVAGAAIGLFMALRRRDRPTVLLGCWFLVPLLALLLISLRKPLYETRYLMMILPAFFLLAAAGLWSTPLPWLRFTLLGTVVIALVLADARYYRGFKFGDRWRDATAYIRREATGTDVVVATGAHQHVTVCHYLREFRFIQGANTASDVNRRFIRGQRLWVVGNKAESRYSIEQVRSDALRLGSRSFGTLTVSLFVLR